MRKPKPVTVEEVEKAVLIMLAALEHIADRVRGPNDTLKSDIDRIARSAIDQAEAAGIGEESNEKT